MDEKAAGPYTQELERFRKTNRHGAEFWSARDLQTVLGYTSWENFLDVVERARLSCATYGADAAHHFHDSMRMVALGSGAEREVPDVLLSRYAGYLTAMNGDASKPEIAAAQAYFAVQTRRQELEDAATNDEKRLRLRDRVKDANRNLNAAAHEAGVIGYARFHDAGYMGLYGGLRNAEIKAKKGISAKEDLLDCVDRAELAANEFRITQTEQKLRREKIVGETRAVSTHHEVGKKVRQAIKDIGGTMPENLPAAPSIKKLADAQRRKAKALPKKS